MNDNTFLIRNASAILTGLPSEAARHAGADIRVRDGVIDEIGTLAPHAQERIVDASDCVVYPAWVNTHHHLFQSMLKGDMQGINLPLTEWLAATPYRFRALFDADLFRLAVRIGMIELMRSGCGTIADHNYLYYPGMPFDTSAILFEEAEALGIRFVLCRGGATKTRQLEADLPSALRPESLDAYLQDIERLTAAYHDAGPAAYRRIVMAPTTPLFSMTPSETKESAAAARRLGIRMHSHLSETVSYQQYAYEQHGRSPVEFMGEQDWLGPDVWFAHLVKLSEQDIRLLGNTHTGVAHCPQSNGRLGSGIAPIRRMENAGMTISIGVDGAASNEAADMISETHAAWLMQRAKHGDGALPAYAGGSFEGGADAASIEDIVRWGTTGGATILGLNDINGLQPGMQADIAIYALDDPRYFGLHDPAIGPVASGGQPNLRCLYVGGKAIVENNLIPGIDLAALGAQAREATRKLLSSL